MEKAFNKETIYHSLAWKKVIEETYGYKPFYYGYEGKSDARVPSMLYKSIILRKKVLASLPFSDEASPLIREKKYVERVFTFYDELFEKEGIDYIEIKGLEPALYETASHHGFMELNPNYRFVLNLNDTVDDILKNTRENIKRNIKKARRLGVEVEINPTNKVAEFYRLHQLTMKRLGTPPHSRVFFQKMVEYLKDDVIFLNARHNNECVAALILFLDRLQRKSRYILGSSHPVRMEVNATSFLFLEAITYSKSIGMDKFGFGVTRPKTGVWHYKEGWCRGEPEKVLYVYKIRDGRIIDPRDSNIEKYTRYWRKIPLFIANFIGPWIRKQIGK